MKVYSFINNIVTTKFQIIERTQLIKNMPFIISSKLSFRKYPKGEKNHNKPSVPPVIIGIITNKILIILELEIKNFSFFINFFIFLR